MTEVVWKTQDGRITPVSEMGDGHLVNTIRFLEKRAEYILAQAIEVLIRGLLVCEAEFAGYAIEEELDQLYRTTPDEYLELVVKQYRAMQKERMKRDLDYDCDFLDKDAQGHTDGCWKRQFKTGSAKCRCNGRRRDQPVEIPFMWGD